MAAPLIEQSGAEAPPARAARSRLPRKLVVGGIIILILAVLAALAPWIAPYRFDEMSLLKRLKPPSAAH